MCLKSNKLLITFVQLSALHSKSSTRTKCDKKYDSCMPILAFRVNIADGCASKSCKLTAKPAISSGNGRLGPQTRNQSITLMF